MSNFENVKIFDNLTLAGLFKKIHKNNKETDKQLSELVDLLKPMIANPGAAVMLMPTVKDLIDVNVRNNEQLIKMAAIVQRSSNDGGGDGSGGWIDMDEINLLIAEKEKIEETEVKLLEETAKVKDKIEIHENKSRPI